MAPLATRGVGRGHPTVVLPSFSLDGRSMARAFEPAFLAQDAAADPSGGVARIYLDLPGTGASPAAHPTSDAVLDAATTTVDDTVGAAAFSVVGWSYGGYLALGLLRRLADRVASALLVCTGTRIGPADRDLSGDAGIPRRARLAHRRPRTPPRPSPPGDGAPDSNGGGPRGGAPGRQLPHRRRLPRALAARWVCPRRRERGHGHRSPGGGPGGTAGRRGRLPEHARCPVGTSGRAMARDRTSAGGRRASALSHAQ